MASAEDQNSKIIVEDHIPPGQLLFTFLERTRIVLVLIWHPDEQLKLDFNHEVIL